MKSAITISLVPEALHGPFVFRYPLEQSFQAAAAAGFDAVELFLPGPDSASPEHILALAAEHHLSIAAVGTGAGMLREGLSLTDESPSRRRDALAFIGGMIDFGARLGAPAILGSMQGKPTGPDAFDLLAEGLRACGERAAAGGVPFIYEPLNRYETTLFPRLGDARRFLLDRSLENIVLLADLFHMNIEESDLSSAILEAGDRIGHVHYADSNRRAMGFGHTDPKPIISALHAVGYSGYLSAEILPLPDPETAARQTIASIRALI